MAAQQKTGGWLVNDTVKAVIAAVLAALLIPFGPGAAPAATAPTSAAPTLEPIVAATVTPTAPVPLAAPTLDPLGAELPPGPITLAGTGTPGSTVQVSINGTAVGTAVVGADGRWSLPAELAEGDAAILAETLDSAGAVAATGDPVAVAVRAPGPGAPTINTPGDGLQPGPATISGTGTPGSTVQVKINGVPAGTAVVGPDGTWSFAATLPEGEVDLLAEALGGASEVLAASDPLRVTVGTAPVAAISAPAEGARLQPGKVQIAGTGVPGTVLEVLNSDQVLAETTVGADGRWSAEVELPEGTAAISVRVKGASDIAGRPIRVTVGDAKVETCAELAVGCKAWVTRAGGLVLRMRSAGRVAPDNIVARLPIGTELELLEGPAPADGFTWWRVRTIGGNEGWVSGENLVLQPD